MDIAITELTMGVQRIAHERARQIDAEGYSPQKDTQYTDGELTFAAQAYLNANDQLQTEIPNRLTALKASLDALPVAKYAATREEIRGAITDMTKYPERFVRPVMWPWNQDLFKPSADPIRNLEKAGALIAAEIDRLLTGQDY